MKAFKTFLGIVLFLLVVYFVLTIIMPKIAFGRKKSLTDPYKITKTESDTSDSYIIRMDLNKGTWENFEYELDRIGWKPESTEKYWSKSPNRKLFTEEELKGFVKEYYRTEEKHVPITSKYIMEYLVVMQDINGFHLYYELRMTDSKEEPLR